MKRKLIGLFVLVCLVVLLVPMTVSAEAIENGWVQDDYGWMYYRNGVPVVDEVIQIGNAWYGFDYEGYMYEDTDFYLDTYYCAKPDGTLYVNQWVTLYGEKYYFGAEGKAAHDFTKIGNVWYFFAQGCLCTDQVVWSVDYQAYFVLNATGTDSTRLTGAGWRQVYGSWYYLYNNGVENAPAQGQAMTIGGVNYVFLDSGKMACNQIASIYNSVEDREETYLADANGKAISTGWAKINGKWYYVEDKELFYGGVYEVGGKLYLFTDTGAMQDTPGENYHYGSAVYVTANGTLLRNQWKYLTVGFSEDIGWAYYDENGYKVMDEYRQIGGKLYVFTGNGIMAASTVTLNYNDNKIYIIDANGWATVADGWFTDPSTGWTGYAEDGQVADGLYEIDGIVYGFHSGRLLTNRYYLDYNEELHYDRLYMLDGEGKVVTTPGWNLVDGKWYYVTNDQGVLLTGWNQISGKTYYLDPQMLTNVTRFNATDGFWYYIRYDGVATKLITSGWYATHDSRIYLENGVPFSGGWKQIGSDWYYFANNGVPAEHSVLFINGYYYAFDYNGKMVKNSWYRVDDYDWVYAGSDGILYEGVQTIDGKQYFFDSCRLCRPWGYDSDYFDYEEYDPFILYTDEGYAWIDYDGVIKAFLTEGWNQVDGKWYYAEYNGNYEMELLRNCLIREGNLVYGLGSDYAMCTGGIQYAWSDYYIFASDGHALTGWHKIDGKWYYANEDLNDPFIIRDGVEEIRGVRYLFKDGYLLCSGTYISNFRIYTSDANGVVTSETTLPNGFTYTDDGAILYQKDGQAYTGWMGDYYVDHGYVYANEFATYGDNLYFMGPDGRYVRNGWYRIPDGIYIYARANGSLLCNQWLQSGGVWYYFYGPHMVTGHHIIGNQYHEFDDSGKWLGEYSLDAPTMPVKPNGWHQISGQWYYYVDGRPTTGDCEIGGSLYAFYNDGTMVSNALYGGHYYSSSGRMAQYVGWKQLGGKWYYFNDRYESVRGLYKIGGKWYYLNGYDGMVANKVMILKGNLYHFGADGSCAAPVTGTRWYQVNGKWYYVKNGFAIANTCLQIGNTWYAFDETGAMITNDISYTTEEGAFFYNASGARVTKAGWYQSAYGWVYVTGRGNVYTNGAYKIGSTVYYFVNGYWVK